MKWLPFPPKVQFTDPKGEPVQVAPGVTEWDYGDWLESGPVYDPAWGKGYKADKAADKFGTTVREALDAGEPGCMIDDDWATNLSRVVNSPQSNAPGPVIRRQCLSFAEASLNLKDKRPEGAKPEPVADIKEAAG